MNRALALARRGQGLVEPNPMVGCVLARDGRIIGEGFHQRFGAAHAEIEALRACLEAGEGPGGCDVYVTLEPCCHHGKTPPCTDALIAARVGRVIAAMVDPFPPVSSTGLARLCEAGIATQVGVCEAAARQLNEPFIKRITTGLPWTIGKWAQSLDGRIATAGGDSKWISNEQSRREVHRLRARVDAVMVGIGTVLADDPQLTARGVRRRRVARRVVVDPGLRLPLQSRLLADLDAAPLTVAVRQAVLAARSAKVVDLDARGVELIGLPSYDDQPLRMRLQPLLEHLAQQHGATNLLVEGGARLMGQMLTQELLDQLLVFTAPKIVGDESARAGVVGFSCPTIERVLPLTLRALRRIGDDVVGDYRIPGAAELESQV